MIKVIAVDFGGVYFTFDYKKLDEQLSKATGVSQRLVRLAHSKKIYDLHVQSITEKDFWDHFCKTIGKRVDHEILKKVLQNHSKPIKSVINLLKKLRKNYKIVLLTNNTANLDRLDKRYKIYKNFDILLSSHIVRMQKPYKNIYKHLIKKAKCKPEEIVFIDDKKRNLRPAKELGINTIFF